MTRSKKLSDLELLILKHVQSDRYQPVKPRVITKQLGLDPARRAEVRKAVKRLAQAGEVNYGKNHLVRVGSGPRAKAPVQSKRPTRPAAPSVVGVFRRNPAGFGFVRPRPATGKEVSGPDIYISARRAQDASSGDVVRVQIRKTKGKASNKGPRGEIIEIVERSTYQFVGTYRPRNAVPLVRVDGTVFAQPVPVGDPGAKNVHPGDKVVIEMVRFPSPLHEGEAVVVEVLGPRGKPGVDTMSIIREYQLPDEFPEEVLEEARRQSESFDPEDLTERLDLTATTIVTIDPADARDFDDAISLEKLPNGNWRLGVHIADVAHFVRPKSALDQEARQRATSVYLPDRVIPMLPEIVSNHLASLQPDQIRLAKTVFMELTPDGTTMHVEIASSAIRSTYRFNYEEVQQLIDGDTTWKKRLTPEVYRLVNHMHELAMVLRRRRMENGSLELILPELKIDLNDDGQVTGAHAVENSPSHQVIEECMLAANEAVAQWLSDQEVPFLRRVHALPSETKLRDLTQFVRDLGLSSGDLKSRFEIQRVLEEVDGKPEERAVNYAVLRSMQKAVYSPQKEGHYALNKTHYCHFTSPIRRYPDLTVHRLIDLLNSGKRPRQNYGQLESLGHHCSDREQRAAAAERELVKIKLLNFLSEQLGLQLDGVITGVEEFGLFVQGVQLPAEGLVHISSLQDDYYHYDAAVHALVGRKQSNQYRLGDLVRVEVFHVDLDRRMLDLRVVDKRSRAELPAPTKKKAAGKQPAGKKATTKRQPRRPKKKSKRK